MPAAAGEGWRGRVVPNKFPLAAVHELIVPTARHVTSLRELQPAEWHTAVALWVERLATHRTLADEGCYVHLFVNDGPRAGASLEHTHAQVLAVPREEQVLALTKRVRGPARCALCALPQLESDLVVFEFDGWAVRAHATPRTGGGLVVAPIDHRTQLVDSDVAPLARVLEQAMRALLPGDCNLWLVHDPATHSHMYVELVPRVAVPAGVELALGIGVATIEPGVAAEQARARLLA